MSRLWTRREIPFPAKGLGCILLVLAPLFLSLFVFIQLFVSVAAESHTPITFHLEKGEGVHEIAENLEAHGLIRSPAVFTLYALFTGRAFGLQSGDYILSPAMNASTIMTKLSEGDIIKEHITIKEGWNLRNIAEEFEKRGLFTQKEFFAVTGYPAVDYRQETNLPKPKDFSLAFEFLKDKPWYVTLEGYLFPDTYQVTANETPEGFVRRVLKNFETNLTADILAEIETQQKTIFEVINLAALLEKEVRTLEDKKIVAGILQKRMQNGMRLQADAAVVYIRDGNYYKVSIEETQIESPYNTYRVEGLPLGPIANPGLESIRAALEPKESPYWFYLSARNGTTIFTRTFDEHKTAKAQYLK